MVGIPGETKLGNTRLVEYGIRQEKSDIRVHVSIATKRLYIFRTSEAVRLIDTGNYKIREARQGPIVTAKGYLIPPDDIRGCAVREIPKDLLADNVFLPDDDEGERGKKAEGLVFDWLMLLGHEVDVETDIDKQRDGIDLWCNGEAIQVKCDWRAGSRERGGTGNLFIQVAECNPSGVK